MTIVILIFLLRRLPPRHSPATAQTAKRRETASDEMRTIVKIERRKKRSVNGRLEERRKSEDTRSEELKNRMRILEIYASSLYHTPA
jgi:hypothetical protein